MYKWCSGYDLTVVDQDCFKENEMRFILIIEVNAATRVQHMNRSIA